MLNNNTPIHHPNNPNSTINRKTNSTEGHFQHNFLINDGVLDETSPGGMYGATNSSENRIKNQKDYYELVRKIPENNKKGI